MQVLTHKRKELFLDCPRKFQRTVLKFKGGNVARGKVVAEFIGTAVERATTTADLTQRASAVEGIIEQLPENEQADALNRFKKCVERSDQCRADEKRDNISVRTQQQCRWRDDQSGWTLVAKPDFIRFITNDRGPVIQIVDEKTAGYVTGYHKRFIHFFGLVVAKQLDQEKREVLEQSNQFRVDPSYFVQGFLATLVEEFGVEVIYQPTAIELVIRLLGDNDTPEAAREVSIGFHSRSREWEEMANIRQVINGIEAAFAADDFPTQTGWGCNRCPFQLDCPAYQAPAAWHAQEALAA
ncbi:hypothetical protein BH10CYA1_BH10CYA1_32440 [soil metagenome]